MSTTTIQSLAFIIFIVSEKIATVTFLLHSTITYHYIMLLKWQGEKLYTAYQHDDDTSLPLEAHRWPNLIMAMSLCSSAVACSSSTRWRVALQRSAEGFTKHLGSVSRAVEGDMVDATVIANQTVHRKRARVWDIQKTQNKVVIWYKVIRQNSLMGLNHHPCSLIITKPLSGLHTGLLLRSYWISKSPATHYELGREFQPSRNSGKWSRNILTVSLFL